MIPFNNLFQICDADMNIINVDASNPGANHDSFIWSNHPLRPHLENLSTAEASWFLGKIVYFIFFINVIGINQNLTFNYLFN